MKNTVKTILSLLKKNWLLLTTTVYATVLFTVYIFAASRGMPHLLRFGFLFLLLLYAGVAFINFTGKRLSVKPGQVKDRTILSRSLFDAIDRMDSPALMCRSDGKLFWCNESLRENIPDGRKPYGKSISDILGVSLERIRDASPADGLGMEFNGRYYIAKYNSIKFERGGALIILTESSELKVMGDELEMIHERLEDSDPVVAYILIDNLTEMMKHDSDSYRPATAKIGEVLREWAADVRGILKEYERDRYLFVFERKSLNKYIDSKFEFLDKIRDIRVGNEKLSVTVSIGISAVLGSFTDKEHSARTALELALSRGGDQVVVKTDEATEIYGGRTKAQGRRSSVRSRVVSNELIMHMSRASNVLIMGHKFPDFDSIAACVGLARIAMFCGVDANIVADVKDKNVAMCKALLDTAPEFRNVFVSSTEGLDLIQTDTLAIIADVNNLSIVESTDIINQSKHYAVIDHHRKTAEFKREPCLEYIEPKASSASELVSEMLEGGLPKEMLTKSEANLLLAGIMLDTKQFTRMTGARTYGAALYLHDSGADPQEVQELFKSGFEDYQKEARFRSNVVIYRDVMAITMCDGSDCNAAVDKISASKAAEGLIGVRGVKAAFAAVAIGNDMHISARSSGEVNVQLILEKLDGGGHFDTAGAQLKGVDAEGALKLLKGAIDEYIAESSTELGRAVKTK